MKKINWPQKMETTPAVGQRTQVAAAIALLAGLALVTGESNAQTSVQENPVAPSGSTETVGSVVVSASRTQQRIMDTAASIDVITSRQIHDGQAEQNLSEPLERVPGIFALNRQNYAQDLLISSRGFGANSVFGARSIKLIVDGIPGTTADGQGQMSHIDLASAERIEVLRGPFSVLYGNSAGGVITIVSQSGKPGSEITPYFSTGSYGQIKSGINASGEQRGINYVLDTGILHTDGYRAHSNADRINANGKLGFNAGEDTKVSIVLNNVHLDAADPLGLTAAQLLTDRRLPGAGALTYNTRKSVDQTQAGVVVTQRLNSTDSITVAPYDGERHTIQYLASAVNGVVNLKRDFYGVNSNWLHNGAIGDMPMKLVVGIESNENLDHRTTFTNTAGQAVVAATDQNFSMEARALDFYVQGEVRPTERLALTIGVRQSQTNLSGYSNNTLPSLGSHDYQATTGMLSAQYYIQKNTNVYVSTGSGFDTPTLNQLIYSPNYVNNGGVNNGNMGLLAARTQQVEVGLKSDISETAQLKVALFDTNTTNDIVIASSNGGKTAYMNAPKTSRKGLEISGQWQLPYQLQASIAATVLNAKVEQAYTENITTTTTTHYVVANGSRLPGVPDQSLFAELMWRNPAKSLEFAAEGRASGSMAANDLNQAYASGYGIMNLRAIARQHTNGWSLSEFVRVDNLLDRSYVGSVIVNQASSQFYESAPGRNWLAGISATYKF